MSRPQLLHEIDTYISKNESAIICNLLQSIETHLHTMDASSINIIRISFLRSSALDDSPLYRIDFYNWDDYADTRRLCFYWSENELIHLINSYKPEPKYYELAREVKKSTQEFHLLKQTAADYFHETIMQKILEIQKDIEAEYFTTKGMNVYYGDYLGRSVQII